MRPMISFVSFTLGLVLSLSMHSVRAAEHYYKGPKACEECHESEVGVWKKTRHAKSYKKFHKSKEAKRLSKVLRGKSPKKNPVCTKCHYTMVTKKVGKKPRARAGTSCESCHGAASEWLDIHKDFGAYKENNEPPKHRAKRLAAARKAGMIYSSMHFEIAENCMSCHGLARPDIDASKLAKLLENKHPVKREFELVRYSQGSVRHRFYKPDVSQNKKMTQVEMARLYVTGQAAKLVSASAAVKRAKDAAYRNLQVDRVESARKALGAVRGIPAVAALLASPSRQAALTLVGASRGKDLSGQGGSALPSKGTFK